MMLGGAEILLVPAGMEDMEAKIRDQEEGFTLRKVSP